MTEMKIKFLELFLEVFGIFGLLRQSSLVFINLGTRSFNVKVSAGVRA